MELETSDVVVPDEDPLRVGAYVNQIMDHVQAKESLFTVSSDYFVVVQKDIKEKMRAILIDWLVDVHLKFKLVSETLFLAINLIDRYLQKNEILKQQL